MNNKRWYILFSVLILLMLGYVVYVLAATPVGELNSDGIAMNLTLRNISTGLLNNSKLVAQPIGLNITRFGTNLTTNASWYIANVSDGVYSRLTIAAARENLTNSSGYGIYDIAVAYAADLNTRTFYTARTYSIMVNITNNSDWGGATGYGSTGEGGGNNTLVKIITFTLYPHELAVYGENGTIELDGEYIKKDGTVVGNITNYDNITGTIRFNATIVSPGNITTNVTWYATGDVNGDGSVEEVILGQNHSIGGTDIIFDTKNGTLKDGRYNITLAVTNFSGWAENGYAFDPTQSFNTTIENVVLDNTAPNVGLELGDSDGIVYTRGEQSATCTFSDPSSGSGLTSSTQVLELEKPNGEIITVATGTDANNKYEFSETDTASTGTYTVRCRVKDGVNAETVTETTFNVWARGGASTGGTGGGKKVGEAEGEEAGAVEQPTGPTGAAAAGGEGAIPGLGAVAGKGTGTTVAVIIGIIVIAGGIIYFLVKGKPGKKGQIKFSRAELMPKR